MKSKTTAYLLWFFLGGIGAHKFYLNKPGMGIAYMFTFGLLGSGWLVDLFTLGRQVDAFNQSLEQDSNKKEPVLEKPTKQIIVPKQSQYESHIITSHEDDDADPAIQAYNAVVSRRPKKTQSSQNKAVKGKYAPLLELCAEIGNDTENNYIPFDKPISVQIAYCDSEGERTTRKVDVRYIAKGDYNDNYYFKAFCHLSNEDRNFRVDRIQKTTVDGRIVDFVQYIVDTYRNTDKYKETIQSTKTRDLLNSNEILGNSAKILSYISRIDGIFTRKEKVVIASFLKEMDIEQDDIEIDDYVKELPDIKITATQYKNIVKNIDVSETLLEKAREIAGKDPIRLGAFEVLFQQYKKKS